MSKKWYNFFISVEPAPPEATENEEAPTPAQTVAEIAALMTADPVPAAPPDSSGTFQQIYESAGIRTPGHGYTILKVAAMLESEHLRGLPREVKRSSVMVALEAAGAALQDIIRDAIRRDRALDACEAALERKFAAFKSAKNVENERIGADLNRVVKRLVADSGTGNEDRQLVAELKRLTERLSASVAEGVREWQRFSRWQQEKREEEQKIAEAVSYFVTENPITICPAGADGSAAQSVAPVPFVAPSPNPAENAG